jgi:hypothetical protein
MQSYFDEEGERNVMSRKVRIADCPIFEWFDDVGVYHELILFGSDVHWLSELNISIEDLHT